ncbi:hypothetical protein [Micromonospora sp. NPDC023644]|uniref:hypothetical protein n=1 Tax=Micromonospora sp. NPDC023644 TaxID=3154321 RepID=UPI0033C316B3
MHIDRKLMVLGAVAVTTVGAFVVPSVASAVEEPTTMPSVVEDYSYPGAAQILETRGIQLFRGDGRITLADCTGDSNLIRVESLAEDVCFAVKGDTGWLSLRLEAVYLVGAGDQDVSVTVEGMANTVEVPEGTSMPVMAVDPARRGVVVELRASPAAP